MNIGTSDQKSYWSGEAGATWVAMAARLDATHAPVTAELVRRAGIGPGMTVLDVGTGGGVSARACHRAGGRVTAIDLSPRLLAAARAEGPDAIDYVEGNAETHRFPGPGFDRIVSQFGMMFFADTVAAFGNLRRAARPGGEMHFLTWSDLPTNPWFRIPGEIAAAETAPVPRDLEGPGPLRFREIGEVTEMLTRAGWSGARGQGVTLALTPPGTRHETAEALTRMGGASRVLDAHGADDATRARVTERVAEALAQFETPDGLRIPVVFNHFQARAA